MATAPRRRQPDPTAPKRPKLAVYAKNGGWPTERDELVDWVCTRLHRRAGQIPVCQLVRDLEKSNSRLIDRRLDEKTNYQVEVWTLDDVTEERKKILFAGEVTTEHLTLARSDFETAVATVPPYWFGNMAKGMEVWDPQRSALVEVHHDIQFNPMIDGKIVDNMAEIESEEMPADRFLFIDPESVRTEAAREYHSILQVFPWSVKEVVTWLMRKLNEDEEFIKNWEVDPAIFEDAPEIKDLELARGSRLNDYLNAFLLPHGYNWCIDFIEGEDLTQHGWPIIRVFKRGAGDERPLLLDPYGDPIAKSQLTSVDIDYNIANPVNRVVGFSSLKEREVTVELYRGWDSALDGSEEESNTSSPVGRRWIANEGADHIGLRPELDEDSVPDFGDDFVVKRRKLQHCLTYRDAKGETDRRHPLLEISIDNGQTWQRASLPWSLLQEELGICFDGNNLPRELIAAGNSGRVRITGTIIADFRQEKSYDDDNSINGRTVEAHLDCSTKFHDRARDAGDFDSELAGPLDEADDADALEEYAEKVGKIERNATVAAAPTLFGLQLDTKIGDLITDVSGRRISLNCLSDQASEKRFPQVIGITHEFGVQDVQTHLELIPYDDARRLA